VLIAEREAARDLGRVVVGEADLTDDAGGDELVRLAERVDERVLRIRLV
jgi:hypothetical protein